MHRVRDAAWYRMGKGRAEEDSRASASERARTFEWIYSEATGEEEAERRLCQASARRVSEKINSPAPPPGPPCPDFRRDESSSSLKPIGLFFPYIIYLSLYFSRPLSTTVRDYERKKKKEREKRGWLRARFASRENNGGEKKRKGKTGRCIGGKKEKSQGEWDIEYSFIFFPLLRSPFSRLLARVYWFLEIPRETGERSARSASAEETGTARRAGEGRSESHPRPP